VDGYVGLVHLSIPDELPLTEPRDRTGRSGLEVARSLYDFLCSRKILVRHFGSHALTSSFLRISVGTDDEMHVLQENIEAWLRLA